RLEHAGDVGDLIFPRQRRGCGQHRALRAVAQMLRAFEHLLEGLVLRELVASCERKTARAREARDRRTARDEFAFHGLVPFPDWSGLTANQPVIIERISLMGPEMITSITWMRMKSTIRLMPMKWIVRADWRPPKRSGSQGSAESMPG